MCHQVIISVIVTLLGVSSVHTATNWPVFFERLGNVHSIHNKWDLTLAVDTRFAEFEIRLRNISISLDVMRPTFLPSKDDDLGLGSKYTEDDVATRNANVKAVFNSIQNHWDIVSNIYKKRVRDLLKRLADYKVLGDKRSFEKYARSNINRMPKMIRDVIEAEDDPEVKSRRKRGACNMSGLFGVLFGVTYQQNIDCISGELEKFKGEVSGNIDNVVNIQNSMSNRHSKELRETKNMVHKVSRTFLCLSTSRCSLISDPISKIHFT